MEKFKGENPYENLTKESFQNARIIDSETEKKGVNLDEPIYRVVTGNVKNNQDVAEDFYRIVDTRFLFKPSTFPSLVDQLGLQGEYELDNVIYGKKVDQQSYIIDQEMLQKSNVMNILSQGSNTIH